MCGYESLELVRLTRDCRLRWWRCCRRLELLRVDPGGGGGGSPWLASPSPTPRSDFFQDSAASVMEGKAAPGEILAPRPKPFLPDPGAVLEWLKLLKPEPGLSPRTRKEPLRRRGVGEASGCGILEESILRV